MPAVVPSQGSYAMGALLTGFLVSYRIRYAMHRLELKVPPAIVGAVIAAGMWFLAHTLPAFAYAPLRVATVGLGLLGVVIIGWAMLSFLEAQTTVNPMKPSSASSLVTTGIYRHSRNPMYLGMLFILVGWALYLANILTFLVLPAFILYMNQFQIKPEERALTARFGREYLEYMSQVHRWI
ncbi:MAG: isoprenylcysteine carboxylmethyltransferase family protein [Nitrospira sp.]|nr:isoprenylcysteine carboxylmethyltransferase family protein [Nitrospira sp.]